MISTLEKSLTNSKLGSLPYPVNSNLNDTLEDRMMELSLTYPLDTVPYSSYHSMSSNTIASSIYQAQSETNSDDTGNISNDSMVNTLINLATQENNGEPLTNPEQYTKLTDSLTNACNALKSDSLRIMSTARLELPPNIK